MDINKNKIEFKRDELRHELIRLSDLDNLVPYYLKELYNIDLDFFQIHHENIIYTRNYGNHSFSPVGYTLGKSLAQHQTFDVFICPFSLLVSDIHSERVPEHDPLKIKEKLQTFRESDNSIVGLNLHLKTYELPNMLNPYHTGKFIIFVEDFPQLKNRLHKFMNYHKLQGTFNQLDSKSIVRFSY